MKSVGRNIDALREAIHHCRNLWVFFITYAMTVGILASSTTHYDLLVKTPLKVPLFNVGVPLNLFYVATPAFLVVLHIDLLMRLHDVWMRGREIRGVSKLRYAVPVFDHFTVSSNLIPDKYERIILLFVSNITIFILPIGVLLFIERQFLPYHSAPITWWHRFMVLFDLAAIFFIHIKLSKRKYSLVKIRTLLTIDASIVFVAVFILSYPGEVQDFIWPRRVAGADISERFWIPRSLNLPNRHLAAAEPAPEILAAFEATRGSASESEGGESALNAQDARSLAERLYGEPIDLSERDLAYGKFTGATLIQADLSDANLTGADLSESQLTNADFSKSRLESARFSYANLRGAVFLSVVASLSEFDHADLQGVTIGKSLFHGADFSNSDLTIANFRSSNFDAASFYQAKMEGTRISDVSMIATDLAKARLQFSRLWFSDLRGATFEGADLTGPVLIGDDLSYVDLRIEYPYPPSINFGEGTYSEKPPPLRIQENSAVLRVQEARKKDVYFNAFRRAHIAKDFKMPEYDDEAYGPPCCLKQLFKGSGYIRMSDFGIEEFKSWDESKWPYLNANNFEYKHNEFIIGMACRGHKDSVHLFKNIEATYPISKDSARTIAMGLVRNRTLPHQEYPDSPMTTQQAVLARAILANSCVRRKIPEYLLRRMQKDILAHDVLERRISDRKSGKIDE